MPSIPPWVQAARPLAAVNVALPLWLGQALAFAMTGEFSSAAFFGCALFGVAIQLLIVFANDLADHATDRNNRNHGPFSGGSRVLPEGLLSESALRNAAIAAGGCSVLVSAIMAWSVSQPLLLLAPLACGGLLWAYSFTPLRLAYRGHGELLQGLGIGVVLPLFGWLAQGGSVALLPTMALVPGFFLAVGGNIATSLPDYVSDAADGKRSYAVRRGHDIARRHALEIIAAAVIMSPWVLGPLPLVAWLPLIGLPAGILLQAWRLMPHAGADQRDACTGYVALLGAAAVTTQLGWLIALALRGLTGA